MEAGYMIGDSNLKEEDIESHSILGEFSSESPQCSESRISDAATFIERTKEHNRITSYHSINWLISYSFCIFYQSSWHLNSCEIRVRISRLLLDLDNKIVHYTLETFLHSVKRWILSMRSKSMVRLLIFDWWDQSTMAPVLVMGSSHSLRWIKLNEQSMEWMDNFW